MAILSQESAHPPQSPRSPTTASPLPQYGFGSEYTFDSLIQDNPFLFRVYTPKTRSQIGGTTVAPFVGQKYNKQFTLTAERLSEFSIPPGQSVASISTYQDVAIHMDWTQRHMSPYISTTFSFVWAIWEATRRYRVGMKHDIEIAVIDARMLAGQAATALEVLRKSTPKERHLDYWKWYRYALESQDVLVYGSIPRSAVLASVPLLTLIDKLPSYFLRQDCDEKLSQFDRLSWDTMDRKPSFRQFCQDMSDQFLRLPTEHRLRDATGGSVRLAMAFLRSWFHKAVANDFLIATDKACSLAFIIAQWPAQWWSRDHEEMWYVIKSLCLAVAEEVREKQRGEIAEGDRKTQDVVNDGERVVQDFREAEVAFSIGAEKETSEDEAVVLPPSPPASVIECPIPNPPVSVASPAGPSTPQALVRNILRESSLDISRPGTVIPSPTITVQQHQDQTQEPCPSIEPHLALPPDSDKPRKTRPHSFIETASCIITGVLVGAFITLCIVNSQRRTLIYVT